VQCKPCVSHKNSIFYTGEASVCHKNYADTIWEKGEVFSPLMVLHHFCGSKTVLLSPYSE
jgi:hypothetical protein